MEFLKFRGLSVPLQFLDPRVHNNVTIIGPENIPAMIPYHASQMYARNITTFLQNMLTKEGELNINMEDEIIRDTLIARDGRVFNPTVCGLLGIEPPSPGEQVEQRGTADAESEYVVGDDEYGLAE